MTPEILLILMLVSLMGGLLSGYPVAFVLPGVALLFALLGHQLDVFDISYVSAFPDRLYGIMTNELLLAVPLFVFMGVMLERSKISEELLNTMAECFGSLKSGMAVSVILVGALLGASTGIVGATVVTMGLISLPCMIKNNYSHSISTGVICAAGTLGQIIPPSIVLILLGDQISNAHQSAQMQLGNLSPNPVSVADIFVGALIPSAILVGLYIVWASIYSKFLNPEVIACSDIEEPKTELFKRALRTLLPPLLLIFVVLGSILGGVTTATESAAVGGIGAMILAAFKKQLNGKNLKAVCLETTQVTAMIFAILIGAALFTLIFRGFGGEEVIHGVLSDLPGGLFMAMVVVMLAMFVLGFFLDFIEIIFVVVPIVAPVLLMLGADPVWLAIMIAINLQTSFLTPPFGFSLFYLRGVADKAIKTTSIYKGVVPFIVIQLFVLLILASNERLITWLPEVMYDTTFEVTEPTTEDDGFEEADDIDF